MRERNYGIDLLRLVLMFFVCILHVLGQGGVLSGSVEGTLSYGVYWVFEIIAYCAVDGFALISGYTATDRPQKYSKIVDMWFQVFFYSFVLSVILIATGIQVDFGVIDFVKLALPVTFNVFWYFTAYVVLFFAIPLLNKFLFTIDDVTAKKTLFIMVLLFSVIGSLTDPFETNAGYSAIWLMVLYCIGVLAKRVKLFEDKKSYVLIAMLVASVAVTWITRVVLGIGKLVSYTSPTILLIALSFVVLFSRLHPNKRIISHLSPLAFGVYLFQLNKVLWRGVLKNAFVDVASMNVALGVLSVLGLSFAIFASGLVVDFIRVRVTKLLKLPKLSEKIVKLADLVLHKLLILLK